MGWAGEGDKNNLFRLKKGYKGDRFQQETTRVTKSHRDTKGGAERKRRREKTEQLKSKRNWRRNNKKKEVYG